MPAKKREETWVIGHKNPDTDSICSAIAYARMKERLTGEVYIPKRAGKVSPETSFVLKKFGVPIPEFVGGVGTQVKDIEIRSTKGVDRAISLKKAWTLMKEDKIVTLPVVKNKILEGIISIGDIANSYMNVYDSHILAEAKTQYQNIVETLEGQILSGKEEGCFERGKVLIAAANPDLMESYIEPHDLVILGNRYESQLCAIEMGADCIIVCEGAPVSITIKKLAAQKDCRIIGTPFDTYTVARLINQSMPVSHFMKSGDLVTFHLDELAEDIREVMAKKRYRYFPVLDENEHYCGMISRRNLLGMHGKRVILVDHNERSQAVDGIETAQVLEIIDHHRLGTMETMSPIYFRNQPLGCTATIVYQMYQENGLSIEPDMAGILCCAILSDTLAFCSPTCTETDRKAAESLAEIAGIVPEKIAQEMFRAGSALTMKTEKEIFYQDYKEFSFEGLKAGIGQVYSMSQDELKVLGENMLPVLEEERNIRGVDDVYFMLTSIIRQSTELLYSGKNARQLIKEAFPEAREGDNSFYLEGVVSRKKQLVPALMLAVKQ